jgi:peptidyl-prolyl cis-trans isomerase C
MNKIKNIIKEPLFLFILTGVLLFFIYQSFTNYLNRNDNVITISKSEIALIEKSFEKKYFRPPSPEEKEALIQNIAKEMVLYKTALEMGLDKGDQVIKGRMVQKLTFLGNDLIKPPQPSEQDLVTFYEKHSQDYIPEEMITITHIFFDPDKREDKTRADAEKALQVLNSKGDFNGDLAGYGDAFMLQNYYPNRTELEIRKSFGTGFTESIFKLDVGIWHGPVLSGYGTHLVYVHSHQKSEIPALPDVREQVKTEWLADMQKKLNDGYIEGLMARYEIVFEENENQ